MTAETLIDYVDWITCPRCRVMRPLGTNTGCDACRRND